VSSIVPTHRLFLVPSASHAMKGEAALTRAGVPCTLIPVPRTLSSECGVCLRVAFEDRERAGQTLAAAGLEISAIHDLDMTRPKKEATGGRSAGE
jgi:hypothetical protein